MIKNYLKVAIRNLLRYRLFTTINMVGLTLGFTCVMLIIMYVNDELSFDRFHKNAPQIYRVVSTVTRENELHKNSRQGLPVGPTIKNEIPGVEAQVRMVNADAVLKSKNELIHESISYVDEDFFSVFSFPLLYGNGSSLFDEKNSVVLTKEKAIKYFGTTDVIGKELSLKTDSIFENVIVKGVVETVPQNSSIQFDFLFPIRRYETLSSRNNFNWMSFTANTFILLKPGIKPQQIESRIPGLVEKYLGKRLTEIQKITGHSTALVYSIQLLKDIHLDASFTEKAGTIKTSDPVYSYILTGIALFILVISCINFVNLNTGLSFRRAKEIGIRKVMGGMRKQLIIQFISESFLLCFLSFLISLVVIQITLPVFNQLSNKKLSLSYIYNEPGIIVSSIILLVLTGFAAGCYPALIVSRYKPVEIFYSKFRLTGKNIATKYLVIFQFGLTIFLITGTVIFQSQFNLLINKDLGYDDKNLVQVKLPSDDPGMATVLKSELLQNKNILEVVSRSGGLYIDGAQGNNKEIGTAIKKIDENFLTVLDIPLVTGRNFSGKFPSDTSNAVIVNETFAKELGWQDPVGKNITLGDSKKATIIGMIRDYHFQSLHEKIMPLVLHSGFKTQLLDESLIKIRPDHIPQTIQYIQKTFKELSLFEPFQYSFLEEVNANDYANELRWKQIIFNASALSIVISCMGLFGLTSLSIVRRAKEIGIRKVFGASVGAVTLLVLKDFIILVLIAFIISIPFTWYTANRWLENFAYRINLDWWAFLLAGFAAISIALLTIGIQAVMTAMSNPVKSLHTE